MMSQKTKKLCIVAMLCALAFLVMAVIRIPVVLFLKYEPKDVVITIGGFLFGPLSSFLISFLVSIVEMFTVSDTGIIGCIMNILSTCAFSCTAALIYKRKRTLGGAAIGLAAGTLFMTLVMLLWNYLITPLYMGYPRQAVAELLIPAFLPFNLLKGGLNAAFTMLLYKPVVSALRKANLLPKPEEEAPKGKFRPGVVLFCFLLLVTCVLLILVMQGKI